MAEKKAKIQPFIKEEVLTGVYKETFPCTAEQIFNLLFSDASTFTNDYRLTRKDTNIVISPWSASDEYGGQVRELNFRSICHSPMCPPDTATTEFQHAVLSPDKKVLVFEMIIQTHDVPFGSYFEAHYRWNAETISDSSCTLEIKSGANFKKWCVMKSKIKASAVDKYKKELEVQLPFAIEYINKKSSGGSSSSC